MTPFKTILAEAERRNGGAAGLAALLPVPKSPAELAAVPDDRYLSTMSLRVFRAGLKHERLIRHWGKLKSVRANAAATVELDEEHGSMGRYLADWPDGKVIALWD